MTIPVKVSHDQGMRPNRGKCYRIALLPGDGIGPEVIAEGVKVVLAAKRQLDGIEFQFSEFAAGAREYLDRGETLSYQTFDGLKKCDAIFLGAFGQSDVRRSNGTETAAQLDLREQLDLYCGMRPVRLYHSDHSPLKGYGRGEIDLLIIRESTEGLFSSRSATWLPDATEVTDTLRVSRKGAERLFRSAFREAGRRRGLVTLVDKANVLPSMVFFRKIFDEVSCEFPDIRAEKIYVDSASLYLIERPHTFDVIVTENLFGDILSDLAAGLVGGLGMAPSGDIGDRYAVFQPVHGSAPDIAGKGIANPTATILSAAMMLEWLNHPETVRGAQIIRRAVERVYEQPRLGTPDLGGLLSTAEVGDRIAAATEL